MPERGRLQVTDPEPAPVPGAVLVVQIDVGPRQFPQLLEQTGMVALHDSDAVGALLAQPTAVRVLGVGRVRGDGVRAHRSRPDGTGENETAGTDFGCGHVNSTLT